MRKHFEERKVEFEQVIDEIGSELLTKINTWSFILSDSPHMRKIAINVCGILC
jgi:hypothetical protein